MEATDKEIILKAAEIMDSLARSKRGSGSCFAISAAYLAMNPEQAAFGLVFYLKQKYCKFYQQPMATLWDVTPEERVLLLLFFAEAGDL